MCITNKRFSEEQENEFIEYTDTTWKTDKEKTDPNDYFFNLLFSENDGLIILFFSPKFSFFYCWKNEGLCKTELVAKINILTKELTNMLFSSTILLDGGGDLILRFINQQQNRSPSYNLSFHLKKYINRSLN